MITASIAVHCTPKSQLIQAAECCTHSAACIFIIDNSPDDSLRATVESLPFRERVVYRHIENRGFGNAHNAAIDMAREAGSFYHLVMNPDVWWDTAIDPVAPLIERMKATGAGLAAPRIVYPDGRLQATVRLLPTPLDLIARRFLPSFLLKRRMRRYTLEDIDHTREFPAAYLQGSFMLFDMEALRETGGFDERFFMYPEDIDISRRMYVCRGAIYSPVATVVHEHAAASRHSMKMLRIHILNMIKYFNKWGWWTDTERRSINRELLDKMPKIGGRQSSSLISNEKDNRKQF